MNILSLLSFMLLSILFIGTPARAGQYEDIKKEYPSVEMTVNEILEGSRIIMMEEDKERKLFYAVAVLPKRDVLSRIINAVNIKREINEVGSSEIKVVIAEGKSVLGDDSTPAQAKAIAMNNARRKAIEEAMGVNLHSSSLIYNNELINDMVTTATRGLIIKQRVLAERCYTEDEIQVRITTEDASFLNIFSIDQ